MGETEFILKEFEQDVFSLTTPLWSRRETEGGAIMQSWLVRGKEKLMVIDSPTPQIPGFRKFIEDMFALPIVMVNTHGHVDHIGCNPQFEEVYMAQEDWSLAAGGGISRSSCQEAIRKLSYRLKEIREGDRFYLGDRILSVFSVPGHTKGSIVLWEESTGLLFSGDAIARRILYGMSDWTPLEKYLEALRQVNQLATRTIYSAHDDFPLSGEWAGKIIANIEEHLTDTSLEWISPVDGKVFTRILLGNGEADENFFDFVIPKERMYTNGTL